MSMSIRQVKKKFRQEVLVDAKGELNRKPVVVYRFARLCAKASVGLFLSIFLGPISLVRPIEIWLMKLGPDKASHFINGIEAHLRRSQFENKKSIKIVVWPQKFPNEALAQLYRRVVYIVGPKQKLFASVMPFVIWKAKVYKNDVNRVDSEFLKRMSLGSPSINFSKKEIRLEESLMSDLCGGINKEFVVLGYTSSEYRTAVDKEFHPLDDLTSAISDPALFCGAIKMLSDRGIGVVRMGHMLSENYELERAGLIVPDYSKYPSGFVEVWLAAKCKFLIADAAGSYWFGKVFNKPILFVNSHGPKLQLSARDLYLIQIPWNLKEKGYESFAWMRANPRWCYDSEKLGFKYTSINNSPEQIIDVVDEQIARLDGTWVETDEDEELQKRFQRFVWGKDADPAYLPRVGAKFLREHQHLLPD